MAGGLAHLFDNEFSAEYNEPAFAGCDSGYRSVEK